MNNTKPTSFDRLCQLRDWLRLEFPKIKEATIERKMGVATNYFKTRQNAPIAKGEKGIRMQTIQNVKDAWDSEKPETQHLNIDWLISGNGEMFIEQQIIDRNQGIPCYNEDFVTSDGINELMNTSPAYYISIPPFNKDGVLCLAISGNSMSPSINSGDKIIMQPVDLNEILYGEIYGIITNKEQKIVRRINRAEDSDMVRLTPDNDDDRYGDYQDIPKTSISKIFRVLCAIRTF